MKKRLFFGFAFFIGFFILVAWQFAAAELADLQNESKNSVQKKTTELASTSEEQGLFI
ncbi:hypothetical protein [Salinimicrobium oceani]|uniref:Uncharacterized protein n=1 Tax=Salinimicrobium oceani TaxID=2722702 RepID=A0ABX1D1G8_9FLAO|nr:hypothetical protein [Salinimicrobium oceani]NJW52974.1 hypothetical protein [Salinimicrobium oceani]